VVNESKLLQEKPEPRNNEAKSHQGKTGANPYKKRTLGGQIIAQVGSLPYFP
jgi:hypothetical protein